MKLGYSNLLGEFIDAQGIGYEDCKGFQIVCPSRREPVFKGMRESGVAEAVHYLSHYEKDKAYASECGHEMMGILVRLPYFEMLKNLPRSGK